ncbi:TonB-dependent receptor plug domain-containing protein [Synoicihabitans lomoniglobus]|uniref:TonB-dependent receptor plug domain-containing protein n=2 Tax=Synoicihabitans lomoniglobus TaxID=2909285 RepID=A0AAE9ZUE0_9BACT|nr:TonB-dependent receptor plug domain-containing protein [Opitutaceae bacterium LMO-M01]
MSARAQCPSLRTLLGGLLMASAGHVFAQTAASGAADDAPEDSEIVELSPFTINATEDKGYRATSTLAGSRINTSLKDVASSVSVVTAEFLKDTAATDINDVFAYMGNTEGTVNYTDAPAQGIGGFADNTASSPMTANRVRGLGSATLTRNYFATIGGSLGFDAYNLDRLTLNRGPNSILFGLGQPAGIIDYSPKLAMLNQDYNEVSLRYGSQGDARATFDFNRTMADGKFAVRATALWADRGYEQEPSKYQDARYFLTTSWKPFDSTTIRVSYENADQYQNNPNSITPIDQVSSWIAAGRPTHDPSQGNGTGQFGTLTGESSYLMAMGADGVPQYSFQEGANGDTWATWWQPWRDGVFVQTALGFGDDSFLPFHQLNLNPMVNDRQLDTFTVEWDQEVLPNLFFNVAYIKEDLSSRGLNFTRSNEFGVFVDVNENLPDGRTNTNFGGLFIPQRSLDNLNIGTNDNESYRGTATWQLDFTERDGWAKWLGKHQITGYYENRETGYESDVYNEIRAGSPSYLWPADRINDGQWQFTRLRYLGGTVDSPSASGLSIPHTLLGATPNTYYNWSTNQWTGDVLESIWGHKRRDLGTSEITSSAEVWQGRFWNDRIVALAGWRQDENTEARVSSTAINSATGLLIVDDTMPDPESVAGDTFTWGGVFHALPWLSFHYNESENFIAAAANLDIFGNVIPPPSGTGKDYGFSLNLIEDKLNMKFNWYEVNQVNSRISNTGPDIAAQWELPWFDQVVIPQLAAQYGETHTQFFSTAMWGDNAIEETADVAAKGTEVEITYNPTPNWRIMANVSRQEAVNANIGAGLSQWIEEVLPTWQSAVWWDGPETFDAGWGVNGNLQDYFTNFNSGRILATYKAEEGKPNPQIREWRANVISNYSWSEGALKGWNLGGALRWESESAIGFRAITDIVGGSEQLVALDLDDPYTDGGNVYLDVWFGYSRRIMNDRFNWNVQVNLRNLTESKGFTPINVDSDGTPSVYRIQQGRTWFISTTLDW